MNKIITLVAILPSTQKWVFDIAKLHGLTTNGQVGVGQNWPFELKQGKK